MLIWNVKHEENLQEQTIWWEGSKHLAVIVRTSKLSCCALSADTTGAYVAWKS